MALLDELEAAFARYAKRGSRPFLVNLRQYLEVEPYDAGLVVIDLAASPYCFLRKDWDEEQRSWDELSRRHGAEWSEPSFIAVSEVSMGWERPRETSREGNEQ